MAAMARSKRLRRSIVSPPSLGAQWLVPGVILARGTLTRSDGTTVDTVVVEAKYVIEKPL